jgi:hypothetical protein
MDRAGDDAAEAEAAALAESVALGWRDDTALRDELEARNPDLVITHEEGWRGRWYATWRGSDGTEQRAGGGTLAQLLDRVTAGLAAREVSRHAEEAP